MARTAVSLPLRTPNLVERAAEAIALKITRGEVAVGEKLPSGTALAEEFGVSVPVIREALSRLRTQGFIQTRHGVGSVVISRQPGHSLPAVAPGALDPAQLAQLFHLRIDLETAAAGHAADLSSREDLQDIRRAASMSDTGHEKGFHLAVARASRNPYRLQMIGYLYEAVQDAVRAASRSPQEEARFQAHCRGEHELVVRAIESHDAPAASAAMRRHLLSVADLLGLPLPGRELVAAQDAGATKKRTRQFDRRRSRLT